MAEKNNKHVVIFVEGDTDKVFFGRLLRYYKDNSKTPICSYEICNMKGVSRFATKLIFKLKNELIPKAKDKNLTISTVCCSYDTDVFEQNDNPAVDWKSLRNNIHKIGISNFYALEVQSSIEDWLLDDIESLYGYLKLRQVPSVLHGKTGYEKIENLFNRANKKYSKGCQIERFVDMLNFSIIRNKRINVLKVLEDAIGAHIQ